MSILRRVAAALALVLAATALSPYATAQVFDENEARALKELIQSAVERALDDPSVGDGNPRTQPPATVFRSEQAPGLSEAQRIELARMVDEAIKRTIDAESSVAADTALARAAPTSESGEFQDERSEPVLDLTADTLRRKRKIAIEKGLDDKAAEAALYKPEGSTETALELTGTGLNSAESSPATSSMQIVANGEGSRASLKLDLSGTAADSTGSTLYWARSLVFSAPLDKNDSLGTTLIGLDGLTNNFELNFNASRIRTEPLGRPDDGKSSLLFDMPFACKKLGIAIAECDLSTLLRVANAKSKDPSEKVAEEARDIAQRYAITGRAWVQGVRLKAGYDKFTFFDPDDLGKQSVNEVPWSTGVFVGLLSGSSYYSAGLDYQRIYKAADSGTACPLPGPNDTVIRCISGALGAPSSKEKHLATLEGRWLFGARAVGVKVVHDFKNDNWGVDVPLYLFPNEKGAFSGGLRFGWTDTDQFSAGVFVGVPFKLLE